MPRDSTRFHRLPSADIIQQVYYADTTTDPASPFESVETTTAARHVHNHLWSTSEPGVPVLYALHVNGSASGSGWHTTDVPYQLNHTSEAPLITAATDCYGMWATFVPDNEAASAEQRRQTCLRAHPGWMNSMRPHIEGRRLCDLFLVGSHDTGSYRYGFNARLNETRVSKYTLTQDDDVHTQLLLGVRYLDIRVGSYRTKSSGRSGEHKITRISFITVTKLLPQVVTTSTTTSTGTAAASSG